MAADLYDFFWLYPPPWQRTIPAQGAHQGERGNVINKDGLPAVILYPSLCTPEIVWDQEKIELLVAFRKDQIPWKKTTVLWVFKKKSKVDLARLKACVQRQLKVCHGLDPRKRYTSALLNAELDEIEIEEIPKGLTAEAPLHTKQRFHGLLHKTAVAFYKKHHFTEVYSITLPAKARLPRPAGPPVGNAPPVPPRSKLLTVEREHAQAADQDWLVNESVKDSGKNDRATRMRFGQYGFAVGAQDVKVGEIDNENPVQTFHPVFHYANLAAVNLGQLSDIHINSRQQALALSPSRLPNRGGDNPPPAIGSYVNVASSNVKALLDQFKQDPHTDAILVTGDLIDFIENVWDPAMGTGRTMTAKQLRALVNLGAKRKDYQGRYMDNVDFLVFYSLVTHYYKTADGKPVYVVAGNHDCYKEAQGIFPTILGRYKRKDTDKYPPLNHNLSIFEACAIFGESFHRLGARTSIGMGLQAKYLGWIHRVLTPFSDFAVQTPKQVLLGLGWGDSEVMVRLTRPASGHQGLGHLPLACESVSGKQLKLLETASSGTGAGKKMVLFSHFTFVSYKNIISEAQAIKPFDRPGHIELDRRRSVRVVLDKKPQTIFNEAEMGTYCLHREELYIDRLARGKLACVLTGHSHRRAMYTLGKISTLVDEKEAKNARYYQTRFERLTPMPQPLGNGVHPIIVCDSSGSLPSRNRAGEFAEFGKSQATGVNVHFDAEGDVDRLSYVCAGKKPRFAAAMSYHSYYYRKRPGHFLRAFKTEPFTSANYVKQPAQYPFLLWSSWLEKWGNMVAIEWMQLDWKWRKQWECLRLGPGQVDADEPHQAILTVGGNVPAKKLLDHARACSDTLFLSIKFAPKPHVPDQIFDGYDFDSPWTFPAQLNLRRVHPAILWSKKYFTVKPRSPNWPYPWDFNKTSEMIDPQEQRQ